MVNVNRFIKWLYNIIFHADDKRAVLKERGHYLVYQNHNELSDKNKAELVKLSQQVQIYNMKLTAMKNHFENYKNKKSEVHNA